MSVKLIQVGDFVTREYPIAVEEFNIGREYTCDLRLDHGRISRNHCRILKRGGRVLVEALYSSAGTALNERILDPSAPPVEVYDGDHLWVGPEHFQFVFLQDGEVQVPGNPNDRRASAEGPKPGVTELPANPLMKDISSSQSRVAHKLLERMNEPQQAGTPEPVVSSPVKEVQAPVEAEPVGTVNVTQMEGVSLVRLLQKAIVADQDIRSVTEELDELIDSVRSNIALHLGNVERMSSQVIGEVFQVYRRCKAKGGMLKICQVSPQVAGVFRLTNMERHIEIFPDEKMALKSIWPQQASRPAPKPAAEKPRPQERKPTPAPLPAAAAAAATSHVQLVVEIGKSKGRVVEIRAPQFLIGRDQQCQLRPNSNAISRLHTAIEQRDGRVFVRDLGTQIGTILNGRVLRDEEVEVFHGDRLQIEVLQFSFAIAAQADSPLQSPTDGSLSGLFGAHTTDASADTSIMALTDIEAALASHVQAPTTPPAAAAPTEHPDHKPKRMRLITFQDIDDVTVVTLRIPDLSEESVISATRVELENILGQVGRDRIVVRFEHVKMVSRGAVVMFLARAQHLIRMQGTMRFCNVSGDVMAFLEKTQLPLLIEIYPTLDEALRAPWESAEGSGVA